MATATSEGSRLLVNPDWNAGLDETTRHFVQAHLLWHVAAGHLRRPPTPGADLHRWHLACDDEVSAVLLMLRMSLPAQDVLFPRMHRQAIAGGLRLAGRQPVTRE